MFDSGITVIHGLQQFSPTMDILFKALTCLGDEVFFLVSLPCIYWCLCKRTGARLSLLFLISAYLNMVAKLVADMPRPFEYSDAVRQLVAASGVGMVVFALGYVGLKILFAGLEPAALFRYIRYGLVGLWGGLGAPWLFLRLKWSLYESDR